MTIRAFQVVKNPWKTVLVGSAFVILAVSAAEAGTIIGTSAGESTFGGVKGMGWQPLTGVRVTYANGESAVANVASDGEFFAKQPETVPNGSAFMVSGTEGNGKLETVNGVLAERFNPPNNTVVTALTVLPGSTANVGSQTVALTGHVLTQDLAVDYNSASPTFGNLSGIVLASSFNVFGDLPLGIFSLQLNGDLPYTLNLIPVWNAAASSDFVGASAPISVATVEGTALINGLSAAFTGTGSGTVQFFLDNQETTSFTFDLSSSVGPIHGTITAQGASLLTPVPEPATILLAGTTAAGLGLARWRQWRRAKQQP
jgi:hypothetical protein